MLKSIMDVKSASPGSFVGCCVDENMDQTSLHVALSRP